MGLVNGFGTVDEGDVGMGGDLVKPAPRRVGWRAYGQVVCGWPYLTVVGVRLGRRDASHGGSGAGHGQFDGDRGELT